MEIICKGGFLPPLCFYTPHVSIYIVELNIFKYHLVKRDIMTIFATQIEKKASK